ncbi:hypothetical protein [Microvirga tunisiensis]|uniref:Uncharacterized protein n=1 Tax=Microvirga tunisiensis TaxID=2108360 RepID=A0A5N7MML2_9HYPH|nr:hypothetical protein [Microvirga tunisiensis]MPR10074.1 hypothetical protein [Microvirga tunisiensis]MPR28265.1 hypothetical protein [Microvirga tunisiensis]
MISTESHQAIMAAIERHWTIHALRRFRERYNLDDYDPTSLIDLVDRIELKYRAAFVSPYWGPYPRVMVIAKLTRRNLSASTNVRIVYQRREQMIVTVLPLRLDPPPQQAQDAEGVMQVVHSACGE